MLNTAAKKKKINKKRDSARFTDRRTVMINVKKVCPSKRVSCGQKRWSQLQQHARRCSITNNSHFTHQQV